MLVAWTAAIGAALAQLNRAADPPPDHEYDCPRGLNNGLDQFLPRRAWASERVLFTHLAGPIQWRFVIQILDLYTSNEAGTLGLAIDPSYAQTAISTSTVARDVRGRFTVVNDVATLPLSLLFGRTPFRPVATARSTSVAVSASALMGACI